MAIRTIEVREKVMARNDELAAVNRALLERHGVHAINLVSSPGSGKTALLERTLDDLGGRVSIAVVTGDVQTANDAERLEAHTDRLVQAVVTGGACHLDSLQVREAMDRLDLNEIDLLFIENVGNLVCPASWDLGENAKVVVFSVTEGEDKPAKYPKMFQQATHAIMNKIDLLPYLKFDVDRAVATAMQINPGIRFFFTSALTGEGMDEWYRFLESRIRRRRAS